MHAMLGDSQNPKRKQRESNNSLKLSRKPTTAMQTMAAMQVPSCKKDGCELDTLCTDSEATKYGGHANLSL